MIFILLSIFKIQFAKEQNSNLTHFQIQMKPHLLFLFVFVFFAYDM